MVGREMPRFALFSHQTYTATFQHVLLPKSLNECTCLSSGSDEERGIDAWRQQMVVEDSTGDTKSALACYDLPFGMSLLRR